MLILGFSGGHDLINESRYIFDKICWHDAAAVLVEDGNILFAIEEERLNRIKHTNRMPIQAISACLASRNIHLKDIDVFTYYEQDVDDWLKRELLGNPNQPRCLERIPFLQERFRCAFGDEVDADKFRFVHHHYSHAMSAFAVSGYESSLIITLDGAGDGSAGIVLDMTAEQCKHLATLSTPNSLGLYYIDVIAYLGYSLFDEYKVMGLAPYGDPERFRGVFRAFYTLLPDGEYEINHGHMLTWFSTLTPRRKGEPFSQEHKDIAAALQDSLEVMAFHVIRNYKEVTKQKNLCLAGGVAHNCTLNGKILRSGMFENVFVQPAAHDAGCALGAALFSYYKMTPEASKPAQIKHVYWGTEVGCDDFIREQLVNWQVFLEFSRERDIVEQASQLLASDHVIGWVQGRSEFGPRALGNRSILADPRPEKNKDRINQLVKKREAYRPFAPSVIKEEAEKFFDVRAGRDPHGFMLFVVDVKKDKRGLLGAITHVDGTARIQIVSRETNERFWSLIRAFGKRTGIPILLNTSFNNNVEPIINSAEDAIVCFLTTGIDYLVIGDYLVKKKGTSWQDYLSLSFSLPPHVFLHHLKKVDADGRLTDSFYLGVSYDGKVQHNIPAAVAQVLSCANTGRALKEVFSEHGWGEAEKAREVVASLTDLWSRRLIILKPCGKSQTEGLI
jgi:carbamoyltransferase